MGKRKAVAGTHVAKTRLWLSSEAREAQAGETVSLSHLSDAQRTRLEEAGAVEPLATGAGTGE